MLRTLFSATILAGALAGSAMAQAPDAGCALPSEPKGIPAAIDAAITGPADKDRACMRALLIPEARMIVRFNRRGRDARLHHPDPGRLDRPRQSPWPRHAGREAAENSH